MISEGDGVRVECVDADVGHTTELRGCPHYFVRN